MVSKGWLAAVVLILIVFITATAYHRQALTEQRRVIEAEGFMVGYKEGLRHGYALALAQTARLEGPEAIDKVDAYLRSMDLK